MSEGRDCEKVGISLKAKGQGRVGGRNVHSFQEDGSRKRLGRERSPLVPNCERMRKVSDGGKLDRQMQRRLTRLGPSAELESERLERLHQVQDQLPADGHAVVGRVMEMREQRQRAKQVVLDKARFRQSAVRPRVRSFDSPVRPSPSLRSIADS